MACQSTMTALLGNPSNCCMMCEKITKQLNARFHAKSRTTRARRQSMAPLYSSCHHVRALTRYLYICGWFIRPSSSLVLCLARAPLHNCEHPGLFSGHDPIRGSGEEVAEISRVESGGSSKSHGSDAVGSAVFHSSRIWSGHNQAASSGPTREKPCKNTSCQ